MKKFAFVLLLAGIFSVTSIQAQDFYWGPKVGLNVSNLTKTSFAKSKARMNFGVMGGYTINDLIGVQAELLYSLQGYRDSHTDFKYKFNYIKVPVLAKLNLIAGLNAEAGISFNFLARARVKGDLAGDGSTMSANIKDHSKKFDFSIPVGLSYRFFRIFEAGIRYDISLARVPEQSNDKAKNSNWSINFAVRF